MERLRKRDPWWAATETIWLALHNTMKKTIDGKRPTQALSEPKPVTTRVWWYHNVEIVLHSQRFSPKLCQYFSNKERNLSSYMMASIYNLSIRMLSSIMYKHKLSTSKRFHLLPYPLNIKFATSNFSCTSDIQVAHISILSNCSTGMWTGSASRWHRSLKCRPQFPHIYTPFSFCSSSALSTLLPIHLATIGVNNTVGGNRMGDAALCAA